MQIARCLALALAWVGSSSLSAQPFPTKPVLLVVSTAPGSGVDAIARLIAPRLADSWSQAVNVENHVGAGGTIGGGLVAKAPADGYTLLVHSSAHVISGSLRANMPYDPVKDFVPVAPLTSQAYVLVVSPQSGIKTVRDLIAAAKAKPGELKFTSAGVGTGTHLMAEKLNADAGISMVHVPTTGAAAGNSEVIAGRVTYWFSSLTPAMPHLREGRLLALGVSSAKRIDALPDVPTVAEGGVPGYDSTLWYGVWAPAGTPASVVDIIARAVSRGLAAPDVKERLAKASAEPMRMTPAEFASFVRAEAESVARIVKAAGIKPQ